MIPSPIALHNTDAHRTNQAQDEHATPVVLASHLIAQTLTNHDLQQAVQVKAWNNLAQTESVASISAENVQSILDAINIHAPSASLPLRKAIVLSKDLMKSLQNDPFAQTLRAKTVFELPDVNNLLKYMALPVADTPSQPFNVDSSRALASLIHTTIPTLLKNTLSAFKPKNPRHSTPQESQPLLKLATFIHTLISSPAANTVEFWQTSRNYDLSTYPIIGVFCKKFNLCANGSEQTTRIGAFITQWLQTIKGLTSLKANQSTSFFNAESSKNRMIALIGFGNSWKALQIANPELQKDHDFVLSAVQQSGDALQLAIPEFQNDRGIVMAAVQQNGWALRFASDTLKKDRDIVLTAVQQTGWVLRFASDEFAKDRELVLEAVQQDGAALAHASNKLKNDRDIVMAAFNQGVNSKIIHVIAYVSPEFQNNRDFVLASVQQSGMALQFASDTLKKDRDIVMTAVRQNGMALQYASDALKKDRDIVMTAVRQNGMALQYANHRLAYKDQEIQEIANRSK